MAKGLSRVERPTVRVCRESQSTDEMDRSREPVRGPFGLILKTMRLIWPISLMVFEMSLLRPVSTVSHRRTTFSSLDFRQALTNLFTKYIFFDKVLVPSESWFLVDFDQSIVWKIKSH
jgi:hypothetical protein